MREKKIPFLSIGIFTAELLLLKYEHVFIGFSILFAYGCYKLYPERYLLAKITKSAYALKLYNVVIWFVSYVLTLKMLSVIYNVNEEYLKYSPALVAIPVSICVLYFFLIVFTGVSSTIGMITSNFVNFAPKSMKGSYEQSIFVKVVSMLQSLMIVLVMPFILAALSTVYVARIAILSDASFLSDCGAKQWGVMYLRKNTDECYKFTLNTNVFSEQPSIVKSKK
ncbi:hypothetical protein C3408_05590 [Candidatus Pantoea alvi]|nr:hypothetical protein C3408_05590 [Pantoea alvi]